MNDIWTLPPAELRGYARGLRETAALLGRTWDHTGMVPDDEMSIVVTATREAWEREAALVEGFAARLDDQTDQPRPVTPERVASWAARFERAARFTSPPAAPAPEPEPEQEGAGEEWRGLGESLFPPPSEIPLAPWYSPPDSPTIHATLADALADESIADLAIVPMTSSEWDGTRWVFRDDEGRITMADSREEATAHIADLLTEQEAAQEGLADAVAESVATPQTERNRAMRSDSPWTDDRLALLARIFPTIMSVDAILEALNALEGLPVKSPSAVRIKAEALGIHRRGEPVPEEYADAATSRTRVPQNAGTTARDHAHSRAENGGKPGTWTTERDAMLRRDYPGTKPLADVFADLNALPGPAIASIGAVAAQAKKMGLQRRVPVAVGEPIAPPPTTPIPPMTTEDQAEALERLRKGIDKGARDVMEYFGCSHDEAMQVVERHRARTGKAA